ncbi:MAG TPA: flagellar biosynthesis protein FlhB [Caulobacteraceae bacterium]|jgi:flagellar biosynthetic protein FlhB
MAEDMENKTEEATPRKLEEARKKGDVAKSPDVSSVLAFGGAAAVVLSAGGLFSDRLAQALAPFIASPHAMVGALHADGGISIARYAIMAAAPVIGAVMLATMLGGVGGSVLQTGLMFSPDKLKPDWKRVSPLAGMKRILGPDGLVQFLKTVIKLCAVGWITWLVLKPHASELQNLAAMAPLALLPFSMKLVAALLISALAFLTVTAGADFLWQKLRFAKKMRMSHHELKEDYKQSEGDPHIKAKLKQIRIERSRRRMMANLAKATVVVTNPTHYAVALRYDDDTPAPICVAKGVDALALRIREKASEHGVPIVEDVPLARALYAAVDLDETIPTEHYQAVAKVISFVMNRRRGRYDRDVAADVRPSPR